MALDCCLCVFWGIAVVVWDAAELEEGQFLDTGADAGVVAEYRRYMRVTTRWVPGLY